MFTNYGLQYVFYLFHLSSPTSGGRSVGTVRSRTQATEFSLVLVFSFQENSQSINRL
jgi:hypothetical protein